MSFLAPSMQAAPAPPPPPPAPPTFASTMGSGYAARAAAAAAGGMGFANTLKTSAEGAPPPDTTAGAKTLTGQ
jgi:hypothetical protein